MSKEFSCWSFVEFYLLENIQYELTTIPKAKKFLRSYEYFTHRFDRYWKPFTEAFALTLRDYLWFASVGEARHSGRNCGVYIPEMEGYLTSSRSTVYYELAPDYPPTRENRERLFGLFDENYWADSYGGERWAKIVESIGLYEVLDPVAFIDHCADLQHNGGVAFDKGSVPFWSHKGYGELMNFLSFKFQASHLTFDILYQYKAEVLETHISTEGIYLFNKMHALVRSHSPRLNGRAGNYDLSYKNRYDANGWFSSYVDGGREERCPNCGDYHDQDDMYYNDNDGYYYCDYCVDICWECNHVIFPNDDKVVTANGDIICYYCYENEYFTCESCHEVYPLGDEHDHEGYSYCEHCYYDEHSPCEECGEVFRNDEMEWEDTGYYCEDCHEDLKCTGCDELVGDITHVLDLDQYPNVKYISQTKTGLCQNCIKKYLDCGYEIWYTINGMPVMSKNIEEVLRYPYKDLLKVHLTEQFTYENLIDTTQRRLLNG